LAPTIAAHPRRFPLEVAMPMTAADLVSLLDLASDGRDRYVGVSHPSRWRRVFGGQVLAQALVAASRTTEDRAPHSLHAYFLLGGDPKEPIVYEVERVRDGRSFTTRRVVARQRGEAIFVSTISFQVAEPGFDHASPMPDAPSPEASIDPHVALAALDDPLRTRLQGFLDTVAPMEFRPIDASRFIRGGAGEPRQSLWIRIGGKLPDAPMIHRAALAYLSDLSLLDTALIPHGLNILSNRVQVASLDHALWFHRPFRADAWLLYVQDSPSASGARGLTRGELFTQDGVLVASVAQEGLMRPRRDESAT
jgi:acyl-CoA thioesterase-2